MPRITDPRANGFNYGSPLSGRNPPVYHTALKVAHLLSEKASELDAQAHELEMGIKDVRTACNGVEKAMALADLEKELTKHLPNWIMEERNGQPAATTIARQKGRNRPRDSQQHQRREEVGEVQPM